VTSDQYLGNERRRGKILLPGEKNYLGNERSKILLPGELFSCRVWGYLKVE